MSAITLESGAGTLVVLVIYSVISWLIQIYWVPYLSKKAENLATKQDIAALTHAQEAIRAQFAELIERQRSESQLRLAVVERRFEMHQKAHHYWIKLLRNAHVGEIGEVVVEAQEWWDQNSLYLDAEVRRAFKSGVLAAFHHRDLLQGPRDAENMRLVQQNWDDLVRVGPLIESAVNLPRLDIAEVLGPGQRVEVEERGAD